MSSTLLGRRFLTSSIKQRKDTHAAVCNSGKIISSSSHISTPYSSRFNSSSSLSWIASFPESVQNPRPNDITTTTTTTKWKRQSYHHHKQQQQYDSVSLSPLKTLQLQQQQQPMYSPLRLIRMFHSSPISFLADGEKEDNKKQEEEEATPPPPTTTTEENSQKEETKEDEMPSPPKEEETKKETDDDTRTDDTSSTTTDTKEDESSTTENNEDDTAAAAATESESSTDDDDDPNNVSYAFTPAPPLSEKSQEKVQQIFDKILWLDMIEVHLLTQLVNEKLGISWEETEKGMMHGGGGAMSSSGGAGGGETAAEEVVAKTIFDLKLIGFDAKAKIKVIKEVRAISGLGLKEAKELVESAPKVIQKELKQERAEELKAQLEAAGAEIELV
jgi:large subunit ribosomal protein L7/L12